MKLKQKRKSIKSGNCLKKHPNDSLKVGLRSLSFFFIFFSCFSFFFFSSSPPLILPHSFSCVERSSQHPLLQGNGIKYVNLRSSV